MIDESRNAGRWGKVDPRPEPPTAESVVVVRGGPTRARQLSTHAERTHKAFQLDGVPLWGVSVFAALDDIGPASLDGLFQRLWSYRVVHLRPSLNSLTQASSCSRPSPGPTSPSNSPPPMSPRSTVSSQPRP